MKRQAKILVVGSLVMDLIVRTERFPNAGETVLGIDYQTAPGGKGANQAVQAARLGADVTMIGRIGTDDFGKRLKNACRDAGVNTDQIEEDAEVSSAIGNVQIETSPEGTQNRIVVVSGANMRICPEQVENLKDTISEYDLVILQLEIPMEINEIVAACAEKQGVPVMLNPAPSAPVSDELLSHLTYFAPNEHEAADYTGVHIRKDADGVNQEDAELAAKKLLDKGVKNVLITMGDAGAIIAGKDFSVYEPCVPDVKAVDPTAAGDSFIGAFGTAVCRGLDPGQALVFANHVAALTVSKMGAMPSLPDLKAVLDYLQKMGKKDLLKCMECWL